ncbi:MAG: hypothetical protein JXA21_23635 [Anaerolineae bacterium]|nr:hypothetical protein [Anaerolineae bacterium]
MRLLYEIESLLARRRARQQWRNFQTILFLIMLCLLFTMCNMACGVAVYNLQRLGLLPTITPTPIL